MTIPELMELQKAARAEGDYILDSALLIVIGSKFAGDEAHAMTLFQKVNAEMLERANQEISKIKAIKAQLN